MQDDSWDPHLIDEIASDLRSESENLFALVVNRLLLKLNLSAEGFALMCHIAPQTLSNLDKRSRVVTQATYTKIRDGFKAAGVPDSILQALYVGREHDRNKRTPQKRKRTRETSTATSGQLLANAAASPVSPVPASPEAVDIPRDPSIDLSVREAEQQGGVEGKKTNNTNSTEPAQVAPLSSDEAVSSDHDEPAKHEGADLRQSDRTPSGTSRTSAIVRSEPEEERLHDQQVDIGHDSAQWRHIGRPDRPRRTSAEPREGRQAEMADTQPAIRALSRAHRPTSSPVPSPDRLSDPNPQGGIPWLDDEAPPLSSRRRSGHTDTHSSPDALHAHSRPLSRRRRLTRSTLALPLALVLIIALIVGVLTRLYIVNAPLPGSPTMHPTASGPSAHIATTPSATPGGSAGSDTAQPSGWLVASQRSGAGALIGVNLATGQVETLVSSPQVLASSAQPGAQQGSTSTDAALTWRALSYSPAAHTFAFILASTNTSSQSLWIAPEVKETNGMPQMAVSLARELLSPCEGPCLQPVLSPSGDLALVDGLDFTSSEQKPSIEMLSVPSGAPRVVVTGDAPACSPDGAHLAYTPSVDEPTQLTLSPAQDCVPILSGADFALTSSINVFDDSWSGDGKYLAFTLSDPMGGASGDRVYVVPLDAVTQAMSASTQADVHALAYPVSAPGCSQPVWAGSGPHRLPDLLTFSCDSAGTLEAVAPGPSAAQPILWQESIPAPQGFTWSTLHVLAWLPA